MAAPAAQSARNPDPRSNAMIATTQVYIAIHACSWNIRLDPSTTFWSGKTTYFMALLCLIKVSFGILAMDLPILRRVIVHPVQPRRP